MYNERISSMIHLGRVKPLVSRYAKLLTYAEARKKE